MSQNPGNEPISNPYEPDPGYPSYGATGPTNPNTPQRGYDNPYTPYSPSGPGPTPNPYDPSSLADPDAPTELSFHTPPGPIYPPRPGAMNTTPTPQPPSKPGHTRLSGLNKKVIAAVLALVVILGATILTTTLVRHNQDVANSNATATAQARIRAITSVYPFSNRLALNDPLTDNSHALNYGWDIDTTHCFFGDGTYHVVESENETFLCGAKSMPFTNFTYEAQMTIERGGKNAAGGLLFRANLQGNTIQGYYLLLDTQGNYQLYITDNQSNGADQLIKKGSIPGFTTGFMQRHTLGIVAKGSRISLYVDTQKMTEVMNSRYTRGVIGVLAKYGDSATEVDYNNAKVWTL